MYRTNAYSEYGELHGLKPSDLTEEQLGKIHFPKLLEFIPTDQRVEKIISEKLFTVPINDLSNIKNIPVEEAIKKPLFLTSYNDCLRARKTELDGNGSYYGRSYMVIWALLDNANRESEFNRWIKREPSVIDESNIDFEWLYSTSKDLADQIVKGALERAGYNASPAIRNLMARLPKEEYLKWLPEIFKKDKYIYILSLSNPNTPSEFTVKALKSASKLTRIPKVKVKIDNNILMELPPVTRLEILEKVLDSCSSKEEIPFTDVHNPDDLKQLVFSTTTRHWERINNLVNRYKRLTNWRDEI